MSDVKITLEATHKQFIADLATAAKSADALIHSLSTLSGAHDTLSKTTDKDTRSTKQAREEKDRSAQASDRAEFSANKLGAAVGRSIALYAALYQILRKTFSLIEGTVSAAVQNIDDFQRSTIGTAAAITNIADQSQLAGRTWKEVFQRNLEATKGTFVELERLSARYFSTSTDLQLAYNAFAQRGVVIRKAELEQLAQLTDLILLLTQGQQSTIQVQEEIRSLINGTIRPTSQLSQLLKSFGADVKDVAAQIKATQSLRPLEGILKGAQAATTEIQKTFQASKNGLETVLRQVGRLAGAGFFSSLTGAIQTFTQFLNRNKERIGAIAAIFGNVLGDLLTKAEKFAETFLSGKSVTQSIQPFIKLVAVVQTLGEALFRVVEIVAVLLRDMPRAVAAFTDALDLASLDPVQRKLVLAQREAEATLKKFEELAASGTLSPDKQKLVESQIAELQNFLSVIEAQLDQKSPWDTLLDGAKKFFSEVVPGAKESKGVIAGVQAAVSVLGEGLKSLGDFDFSKRIKTRIQEITGAFEKAQKDIASLNKPSTATVQGVQIPFKASDEQLAEQRRLIDQVTAARIRLARAERTEAEGLAAQNVEVELQGLRRRFALIEQGFRLTTFGLDDIRTAADDTIRFLAQNLQATAKGVEANFIQLGSTVADTVGTTLLSVFSNLTAQLHAAEEGLKKFKESSEAAAQELIQADAQPHFERAQRIEEAARKTFETTVGFLKQDIIDAEKGLGEALAVGDKDNVAKFTAQLEEAKQRILSGTATANKALEFALKTADQEQQLGILKEQTIEAQKQARINAEDKKIREERLRIDQQILAEAGKLGQGTIKARADITAQAQAAEAAKPRTDLQAALGQIQLQRTQIASTLSALTGGLDALDAVLQKLEAEQNPTAAALRDYLAAKRLEVDALDEAAQKAFATAEKNAQFAVSLEAIGNAATNTLTALSDALLNSFEGKKTDFARTFKGLADSLFKDSLKNVFQTVSKDLQEGFKDMFKALNIPDSMAGTLGPAFLAGFALIASFVLGQLLNGNNATATPGNAQVGISSTEQVRGIIGGETQIPIGLVGESLQDALIPTNLLLSRIARGVERISVTSGLSQAQIEGIISQSVNDAIQIQGA